MLCLLLLLCCLFVAFKSDRYFFRDIDELVTQAMAWLRDGGAPLAVAPASSGALLDETQVQARGWMRTFSQCLSFFF
jgi:hypothetical protein